MYKNEWIHILESLPVVICSWMRFLNVNKWLTLTIVCLLLISVQLKEMCVVHAKTNAFNRHLEFIVRCSAAYVYPGKFTQSKFCKQDSYE